MKVETRKMITRYQKTETTTNRVGERAMEEEATTAGGRGGRGGKMVRTRTRGKASEQGTKERQATVSIARQYA